MPEGVPRSAKKDTERAEGDPQLAGVVAVWPNLSEPIRAAILAMVQTGQRSAGQPEPKPKE